MGILQANIWRHSKVRSIRSLFSSPTRSIKCVIIPETGIVRLDDLKLAAMPYVISDTPEAKQAWVVIQKLLLTMRGCEEMVLPVSERSYVPLDPLHRLTEEDRKKLVPLSEIAETQYDTAFARVTEENKQSANAQLLKTMIYVAGIIACIAIIVVFLRGCGG